MSLMIKTVAKTIKHENKIKLFINNIPKVESFLFEHEKTEKNMNLLIKSFYLEAQQPFYI